MQLSQKLIACTLLFQVDTIFRESRVKQPRPYYDWSGHFGKKMFESSGLGQWSGKFICTYLTFLLDGKEAFEVWLTNIIVKKKAVEGTLWKTNTWKLCNLPAFVGSTMASLLHCWQAIVFCPLSHPFEIMAHNFFRQYKKVGLHSFFFFDWLFQLYHSFYLLV